MKFVLQPPGGSAKLLLALITLCLSPLGRAQRPIAFDHLVIDPAGPRDPWGKTVGDLNADGAPDLIVGGFDSGGLIWYENPSWSPRVISGLTGFRTDHETGDVDRDGLLDVVSLGTDSAGRPWVGWFKNPGPGADWVSSTIDTNLLHDLEVADLNGDGQVDVIGRNQEAFKPGNGDTLFVYTQVTPSTWSKFTMLCANGEGLKVADVNRDSRPDIVVNGSWFENRGIDTVWVVHSYTSTYTYRSVAVEVADVDDDGLADIILSPSEPAGDTYRISWFKAPTDPSQAEWIEHVIEDGVETVHHSIGAADLDYDGTMDVISAQMNTGSTLPEVKLFLNGGQGQRRTRGGRKENERRLTWQRPPEGADRRRARPGRGGPPAPPATKVWHTAICIASEDQQKERLTLHVEPASPRQKPCHAAAAPPGAAPPPRLPAADTPLESRARWRIRERAGGHSGPM